MPVYSSNQNPKYAKAGDTLGINFNTTDIIASHTGQILGLNASATVNDTEYNATVIVPSTPRESYATFTIQVLTSMRCNDVSCVKIDAQCIAGFGVFWVLVATIYRHVFLF